jgi:hypothetical protein
MRQRLLLASVVSPLVRLGSPSQRGCSLDVKRPPTTTELSEKYRLGTPADTPASLRRKAAEFLRMAENVRDIEQHEELRLLNTLYTERASELERSSSVAAVVHPPGSATAETS